MRGAGLDRLASERAEVKVSNCCNREVAWGER
jgi:hypothetical protein